MRLHKLVIIGVGHVGSYVLADAMKLRLFAEIALIDRQEQVARGEAMDQAQATALTYMSNIDVHAGTYRDCADADVIIIAAGPSILKDPANPEAQPDRAGLAVVNAGVIREVMGQLVQYTREAVVILITNPLDTMVYIAETEFNYPRGRLFGTGTMLDSARLRKYVADYYKVDPKSVCGYMMGEHGATAFPVLSHLNIQGIPVSQLPRFFPGTTALAADSTRKAVVKMAFEVLNSKGWTNAGVAQSAITLAQAVLLDERTIYPVSRTLYGCYGFDGDVALSVPSVIGRQGVAQTLPVNLNEQEQALLQASAAYIRQTIARVCPAAPAGC
ncbi:MAG: L-lactate dehydrogenase [Oscillospiraceae bacterium]|nr:L-lactate dehydrogenase [Oscillospiraceae bacterium]MDD4367587.1 L-lactate dehydrogenase [Oscillospiraceae bacterium]